MSKRGQAILPFFAQQLISIMIFFIVLLALLTMTKNVKFTVNEFDERTASLLTQRRLFSTADCFAADSYSIFYDNESHDFMTGRKVHPGLVDIGKLRDFNHFNCMRKDLFDKVGDVTSGYWDADEGTGGTFKYSITAIDLEENKYVFNDPVITGADSFFAHEVSTLTGRAAKTEGDCHDEGPLSGGILGSSFTDSPCTALYGASWDCIDYCFDGELGFGCKEGRCEGQERAFDFMGNTSVKPIWLFEEDYEYTFDSIQTINVQDAYKRYSSWDQFAATCFGDSEKVIYPIRIKSESGDIHNGLLLYESCTIKGWNYEGRTTLEVSVKPKVGGQCVG